MSRTRPPRGYRYYAREFLNLPGHHGRASVLAWLKDGNAPEGGLEIADCYRMVSFELDLWEPSRRRNTLRKLSLLASRIQALHDEIVAAYEERDE